MTAQRSTSARKAHGVATLTATVLVSAALLAPSPASAVPPVPVAATSAQVRAAAQAESSGRPVPSVQAPTPTVRGTAAVRATVRATAAKGGVTLGTLDAGVRVPTTGAAANGWVPVRFHGAEAYVLATQLWLPGTGDEPVRPAAISTNITKIATASLVVRSGPARSQPAVARIGEGRALTLTGPQSNGYAQTRYGKKLLWVSVRYLGSQARAQTALDFARAQIGKPYKFGAEGPKSYDCSGLTQTSWKAAGVTIPRTAAQQSTFGTKIKKSQLRPGDLVFFYGRTPSHVAIYAGGGLVVHAPRPGKTVQYLTMSYMPYSGARRPG